MGAVILGKEAIGEAAGWAGSEVAGLITDNEQIKMIAGMASSMAASGMSNKIDNYFNLSRKPFLSGMSVDDAARYNAYWDSLGNGTHTLPNMNAEDFARFQYGIDRLDAVYADRILADSADDILKIRNAGDVVSNIDDYLNSSRKPFITGMSADDAKRYTRWNTLLDAGLDQDKINDIILTNKGLRPDPSTYLSQNYIETHLAQFDGGASIIMTKEQYVNYVKGNDYIGIPYDGTQFVMPKSVCDEVSIRANGDISVYEIELGFDVGHFEDGGGLIRIDIDDLNDLNLRLPSGNETGANSHWIPGGYTDGGVPEAVTNLIPNDMQNVTITEIK